MEENSNTSLFGIWWVCICIEKQNSAHSISRRIQSRSCNGGKPTHTHTHTHTHKTHDEHMLVGGKGAGYYTNKGSPYAVKLRLIVFCREWIDDHVCNCNVAEETKTKADDLFFFGSASWRVVSLLWAKADSVFVHCSCYPRSWRRWW